MKAERNTPTSTWNKMDSWDGINGINGINILIISRKNVKDLLDAAAVFQCENVCFPWYIIIHWLFQLSTVCWTNYINVLVQFIQFEPNSHDEIHLFVYFHEIFNLKSNWFWHNKAAPFMWVWHVPPMCDDRAFGKEQTRQVFAEKSLKVAFWLQKEKRWQHSVGALIHLDSCAVDSGHSDITLFLWKTASLQLNGVHTKCLYAVTEKD